jgi:hypothetical protein
MDGDAETPGWDATGRFGRSQAGLTGGGRLARSKPNPPARNGCSSGVFKNGLASGRPPVAGSWIDGESVYG